MSEYVFGYASLVAAADGRPCELHGFRRVWGVAMDNAETIPGYKCYRAPDGSRPAVCVAFLDLEPAAGAVNGVCTRVEAAALAALDRRERNYGRVDVTGAVPGAPGRVWAFLGRRQSRERLRRARAAGHAVVHAGYVRAVDAGFRALGAREHARFLTTTVPAGLPHVELERIDLPERG